MRKLKLYIGLLLGVMTMFMLKGSDLLYGMPFSSAMLTLFISSFFIVTPPFLIIDFFTSEGKTK